MTFGVFDDSVFFKIPFADTKRDKTSSYNVGFLPYDWISSNCLIRLAVKPLQVSEHFHFRIVYKGDFPDWTSETTFMVVEGYPRASYDDLCFKKYLFLFLDLENPCFLSKSVRVVNSLQFSKL